MVLKTGNQALTAWVFGGTLKFPAAASTDVHNIQFTYTTNWKNFRIPGSAQLSCKHVHVHDLTSSAHPFWGLVRFARLVTLLFVPHLSWAKLCTDILVAGRKFSGRFHWDFMVLHSVIPLCEKKSWTDLKQTTATKALRGSLLERTSQGKLCLGFLECLLQVYFKCLPMPNAPGMQRQRQMLERLPGFLVVPSYLPVSYWPQADCITFLDLLASSGNEDNDAARRLGTAPDCPLWSLPTLKCAIS